MDPDHSILFEQFWRAATGIPLQGAGLSGKLTVQEAQAIQLQVLDRWCARGESLGGWKVGLTSGKSRDAFGPGVRPFGHVLANRIIDSDDELRFSVIRRCGIESEVCFVMRCDLEGAHVTAAEARDAVLGVAPAFEVNETRIVGEVDGPARLADNLSQWGIVVGPLIKSLPDDFDWDDLQVVLKCDGTEVERVRAGGNIDDHFESLAALVRGLSKFGRHLGADQHVITGSLTRHVVPGPGNWEADFGALGRVAIRFD